jgi:endonuclease III
MKENFNIETVLARIEKATKGYPKAAMFELADRGYSSLFEQLVSCIISIRTLDETTIPVSLRLFKEARTPESMLKLGTGRLTALLYGSTFPEQKTQTILGVARAALEDHGGQLPADYAQLTELKGVGPKCANLALGVAEGKPGISVDVHVHRVVNRWGYVQSNQPEGTLLALEQKVPTDQWIHINRLLMPFGKHICTGVLPKCSACPVLDFCEQVGVSSHR